MFWQQFQVADVSRLRIGEFQIDAVHPGLLQARQDRPVIPLHIAPAPVHAVAAVQVHLGFQPLGDAVDRDQGLGELSVDVPVPSQPLIVDFITRHQPGIAEIGQGRVVELNHIDTRRDQGLCLAGEEVRQVVHEVLQSGISLAAVVLMPVADPDQKGTRQGELGAAVGIFHKEAGICGKDRLTRFHAAHDHIGVLDLPLVFVAAAALEAPYPLQKLTDVVGPPPLAVADDV